VIGNLKLKGKNQHLALSRQHAAKAKAKQSKAKSHHGDTLKSDDREIW
jgi:hypothetical protein